MSAEKILRTAVHDISGDFGCYDPGCIFGSFGGMGTNGGCDCIKDVRDPKARRKLMVLSKAAHRLAEIVDMLEGK